MKKLSSGKIVVAGSLAFDTVMNFPGKFSDHLMAGKIHDLSLSFTLSDITLSHGGTAGNIAYNLALLKEPVQILTAIGADFFSYGQSLKKIGVDLVGVKQTLEKTAAAFIITDKQDNQIAGFFPGPSEQPLFSKIAIDKVALTIISPDQKQRMLAVWQWCQRKKIPYIFDPGQQVINFSASELLKIIKSAELLIGNDYEIEIIRRQLKKSLSKIMPPGCPLIITKGEKGSEIIINQQSILISAVKPKINLDPTGAGDAYRAGLIKGIVSGLSLDKAAQLGATIATYAIEKKGTQAHTFNLKLVKKRFYANFKEKLLI